MDPCSHTAHFHHELAKISTPVLLLLSTQCRTMPERNQNNNTHHIHSLIQQSAGRSSVLAAIAEHTKTAQPTSPSDAAVKPMHSCQGLGFNAATHATVHTTHTCITTMQLAKILSQNSMLAPTQSCPMF
jgi:hypothetical protein